MTVRASFLYFVRNASGRIKIGFASDVRQRLATLRVSSSEPLELMGVIKGGRNTERDLHSRFAHSRSVGEWFEATPGLLEWIEHHAEPFDDEEHRPSVDDERLRRLAEASRLLMALSIPTLPSETVQSRINRVASVLGMAEGRIRSIWYQETRAAVRDKEMSAIYAASGISAESEAKRVQNSGVVSSPERIESALASIVVRLDSMERAFVALRKVILGKDRQAWIDLIVDPAALDRENGTDRRN